MAARPLITSGAMPPAASSPPLAPSWRPRTPSSSSWARLFPFGIDFTCRFFVDVVNDILIAHFRHQFFGCRSLRFGYTQQRKEKGKDQHNNEGHKRIGCQGGI